MNPSVLISPKSPVVQMSSSPIDSSDVWTVIKAYFTERGLIRQHLDSFDLFINTSIQEVIDNSPDIILQSDTLKTVLSFGQVYLSRPTSTEADGTLRRITPNEARLRGLTYAAQAHIDVTKTENDGEPITIKAFLGEIPVMVHSSLCVLDGVDSVSAGECPYDQGGYFVVNGGERVIIEQERMSHNTIHISSPLKCLYAAEIRSQADGGRMPSKLTVKLLEKGRAIVVNLKHLDADIPISVFFRALGVLDDADALKCIGGSPQLLDMMSPSIHQGLAVQEKDDALNIIGRHGKMKFSNREKRVKYGTDILQRFFLPHVGPDENKKANYLGYITNRLLSVVLGYRQADDRDHYANKRIDLSGPLLMELFSSLFARVSKDTNTYLEKNWKKMVGKPPINVIRPHIITKGFKYAIVTGNWGTSSKQISKVGITEILNRLNHAATLSHLRRVTTPIGHQVNVSGPRQLHNTHWGMICPAETPEGGSVGLVKNMALMSDVTIGSSSHYVTLFLCGWDSPVTESSTKMFVNGDWIGSTSKVTSLVKTLLKMRRSGELLSEISVFHDRFNHELMVSTDMGRCCRPLFILKGGKLLFKKRHLDLSWREMVREGLVEMIDTAEEQTMTIAMTPEALKSNRLSYTHCEVHPSMIFGISASIIPFPDHSQAPRITYQSAMGKQAMGIYTTNFQLRMDTVAHTLLYPQKPIVDTRAMEVIHFNELPAGQNCIVAIACYGGYNQEDSILLNKSSVDRGLFRSTVCKTYMVTEDRESDTIYESFECPMRHNTIGMGRSDYSKLDKDGLIPQGVVLCNGDVIIGKVSVNGKERKDCSTVLKISEPAVVDRVLLTVNADGRRVVKVRTRALCIPEMGDKFSSRHGQKGTVGMLYRQEDMPFTSTGIVPDLIINPHCVPSRMTIGQLLECILGKTSAVKGTIGDGTPFMGVTPEKLSANLLKCGYAPSGSETLYNGMTGQKIDAQIFIGPTYYQRLKHLVIDKIHARARGPLQILTRQPLEGKAREGGLRFGEMERDVMISHGASAFLRERLYNLSDPYLIYVCDECGLIARSKRCTNVHKCLSCGCVEISRVKIPYVTKLLFQELMSMAISPRIRVDKKIDPCTF
jgi:DNA-directed RNA polymerase II subunit RPB2